MTSTPNFATPDELRAIAQISDKLSPVMAKLISSKSVASFGDPELFDSNGESLGFLVWNGTVGSFVFTTDKENLDV